MQRKGPKAEPHRCSEPGPGPEHSLFRSWQAPRSSTVSFVLKCQTFPPLGKDGESPGGWSPVRRKKKTPQFLSLRVDSVCMAQVVPGAMSERWSSSLHDSASPVSDSYYISLQ